MVLSFKKNREKGGSGGFKASLLFLLSSFFGALFVATAYFYFDYRYSRFSSVDFNEIVFYGKENLFTPNEDRYTVYFFSSKMGEVEKRVANVESRYKILAIDIYQNRDFEDSENVLYVSSGVNSLIAFIHTFKIKQVPVLFELEKYRGSVYRQSSKLKEL